MVYHIFVMQDVEMGKGFMVGWTFVDGPSTSVCVMVCGNGDR